LHTLRFKKSARDELKVLPKGIQERIVSKLRLLSEGTSADALDITPLKGNDKKGYYRLRSGSYRVVYYLDEDNPKDSTILIVGIKHRRDAYK
jgi:mRNA-degrading endonuclease RelE of RelBE toxin-antitoxin system